MSRYEDSIKCKYCSHFEPGVNRCHLYYSYDQSLDKGGGPYLRETSPNDRCESFNLTAVDAMARSVVGKRADGSMIVSLDDDPELKRQLSGEDKKWVKFSGWLIGGVIAGWLIGLMLNAVVHNDEIISAMSFWGAAIGGICGYLIYCR